MAAEEALYIEGGKPLSGETTIQGSKNAALPMIAASLLAEEGQTVLYRIPPVKDVLVAIEILRQLGAKVDYDATDGVVVIDAVGVERTDLSPELSGRLRASVLFVGALLSRFHRVTVAEVGGCNIGERSTDYHYRGFARMGAKVTGTGTGYDITADTLRGANMYCDLPSHTGTENLMMAASLAEGESTIVNAGSDPEISDLAQLLKKMGADIDGVGTRTVRIRGVKKLRGAEHTVMYDRLDAATMMMAGTITAGDIRLKGVNRHHLEIFEAKLLQMGVRIEPDGGEWIRLQSPEKLHPINVVSTYYPGFPTDLQPSITALACRAEGDSYIRETVFEDRFGHVKMLRAFGATLSPEKDQLLIVPGPQQFKAARVRASDIRAGATCVLAGLSAQGKTTISNLYQLDRGLTDLVGRLTELGADVERI